MSNTFKTQFKKFSSKTFLSSKASIGAHIKLCFKVVFSKLYFENRVHNFKTNLSKKTYLFETLGFKNKVMFRNHNKLSYPKNNQNNLRPHTENGET